MGPNDKKFKKEFAHELVRIAEQDLETARFLSSGAHIRRETTLFNVEQAVEKSLKAVLCWLEISVPLTHDLYAVIGKLPQDNLPPGGYALHDLTPFATIRRYEDSVDDITQQDLELAIASAEKVVLWAKTEIATVKGL
jgi:HEPN domain-containing protein